MRKTTSQTDLEEEASKKQSMSKCPQENSTHFKKAQLLLFNYTKGIFLRKYFLKLVFCKQLIVLAKRCNMNQFKKLKYHSYHK